MTFELPRLPTGPVALRGGRQGAARAPPARGPGTVCASGVGSAMASPPLAVLRVARLVQGYFAGAIGCITAACVTKPLVSLFMLQANGPMYLATIAESIILRMSLAFFGSL